MMFADVKANIKQQDLKDLVAYLKKKYFQNLKYNLRRGRIFHSILVGIPFALILSVKNGGGGGGGGLILLNGQNPLSVTEVSLSTVPYLRHTLILQL